MNSNRRLGYFEGALSAVLYTLLFGFKIRVGAVVVVFAVSVPLR